MNWNELVKSPPPDTVWHVDSAVVLSARRDRRGGCRCVAADTPAGTFSIGPVGLQSVDAERLRSVLENLQGQISGSKRPGVVVPTAWVRSFLLELEELPRHQAEIEDVLRWRLKKLLPIPVTELRLAFTVQPRSGSKNQLLCAAVVERAAQDLEKPFQELGITPSLLVPRLTALAMQPGDPEQPRLVVQQEPGFISMVLVLDGGVRMIRTKPLPMTEGAWAAARQEIGMAMTFLRSHLEIDRVIEASVCASDLTAHEAILEWLGEYDDVTCSTPRSGVQWMDQAVVGIVSESRLVPVSAVLLGGMP